MARRRKRKPAHCLWFREGSQQGPEPRGPAQNLPLGLYTAPTPSTGFEAPLVACTHLAWAFRACSMSSRAPTYWGEKVGVSRVSHSSRIVHEESKSQKRGWGWGRVGMETGGAKVKEAEPAEPRVLGRTWRSPPEGRGQRGWWGWGDRLLAPGTALRKSRSTQQCRLSHLLQTPLVRVPLLCCHCLAAAQQPHQIQLQPRRGHH